MATLGIGIDAHLSNNATAIGHTEPVQGVPVLRLSVLTGSCDLLDLTYECAPFHG